MVTRTDAWVRLPKFLGARPDGKPYETYQSQGEITGLAHSTARIHVGVQKPISVAKLTLIARTKDGTGEYPKAVLSMFPGDAETLPTGDDRIPGGDRPWPDARSGRISGRGGRPVRICQLDAATAGHPDFARRAARDSFACRNGIRSPAAKPSEEDIIEGFADSAGRSNADRVYLPVATGCRQGPVAISHQ